PVCPTGYSRKHQQRIRRNDPRIGGPPRAIIEKIEAMTDISAFRSVQGSTGYIQHRQSEPTELKKVGTFPFFCKLVAHFPSTEQKEQNRAIKLEFLNSLEQAYGKEFRQIAQSKIDVNSGKPLERRVVRDLIKQGDDRTLSDLLPSKTFELRPGTEQSMK